MSENPPVSNRLKNAAVYAAFFALGIAATLLIQKWPNSFNRTTQARPITPIATNLPTTTGTKPWGILEYKKIPLEDSEEIFLDRAERLRKPRWFFENHSAKQVSELFQSLELTASQKKELLNSNIRETVTNGCIVSPSEELILQLNHDTREKLYAVLGRCGGNYNQNYPFRFPYGTFDERFATSGLPPEKINFIRNLCYVHAGLLSFCDFEPAQQHLSDEEFQRLIKTLYSIPAVWMKVRVQPGSDVPALLNYWAKGERGKQIKPLLESAAKVAGGTAINVSYFMSPFARLRLYTFPDPVTDPIVAREDCFYTAFNFFNDQPDQRYLDPRNTRTALQTQYSLVQDEPAFGDLVTLINSRGDAVHICVYIADDVVFTKNGANYLQPWVLMKIPDMLAYFPSEDPLQKVVFRRKDFTAAETSQKVVPRLGLEPRTN